MFELNQFITNCFFLTQFFLIYTNRNLLISKINIKIGFFNFQNQLFDKNSKMFSAKNQLFCIKIRFSELFYTEIMF